MFVKSQYHINFLKRKIIQQKSLCKEPLFCTSQWFKCNMVLYNIKNILCDGWILVHTSSLVISSRSKLCLFSSSSPSSSSSLAFRSPSLAKYWISSNSALQESEQVLMLILLLLSRRSVFGNFGSFPLLVLSSNSKLSTSRTHT